MMQSEQFIPLNVMVVDDSEFTRVKLISMLESLGHNIVAEARTGKEAMEKYDKLNPDIVTMDIIMPDMDGVSASQLICKRYPDANILMITSHGQKQMVIDAISAGAKGYILKPFTSKKIKEVIDKVFFQM